MKKMMLGAAIVTLACLFFACDKILMDDHKKDSGKYYKPKPDCNNVKTYTQYEWGASPYHSKVAANLHERFDKVFPHYLTVGCYPKYYVKLKSAKAVTDLLPCEGYAKGLSANYTDPHSIKNALVGHLIALKLSIEFDKHDKDFEKSRVLLCNMIIGHGTFKDWRVSKFLDIAEKILGGCSKEYTFYQVYETVKSINEDYNHKGKKGFLKCPRKVDDCFKCDDYKKDYD